MLIASLVATIALLATAYWLARTPARYAAAGAFCGLNVLVGGILPVHGLASLVCLAAAIGCTMMNASPRRFLQSSLVLATGSYIFVTVIAIQRVFEQNRLRAEVPVESIVARLSYETSSVPVVGNRASARVADEGAGPMATPRNASVATGRSANDNLVALEELIEWAPPPGRNVFRSKRTREIYLRRLHEESVGEFINSPGFGVSRRIEPRREYIVLPEAEPVPQPPAEYVPGERSPASSEIDGPASASEVIADKASQSQLQDLHQNGFVDFVNSPGFGYVKDREHVAGFQPHQFHAIPTYQTKDKEPARWKVQRLELLSLLKFDEPAVYLSDHLPRMDELRDAKTRPPDEFEKRGLDALRRGKDLELESSATRVRMLGSIRSLQQCIQCHQVKRGELLGAFSYVLKRMPEDEGPRSAPAMNK
jgi:hypothetical protein